jgi:uncharacterized protein YkwD
VVLEHHNTHRHRHCAEDLIWDEDLANQAYITAKECPKDFEHVKLSIHPPNILKD